MESNETRNYQFFRFEDLRLYHKSLDYVKWMYSAVGNIPEHSNNLLANSLLKAVTSISVNIAEGSARDKTQFIYYLKMAKTSIRESLVLTTIAKQQGYFNEEQENTSRQYLIELSKMIGALISSLQRSKKNERQEEEDEDFNASSSTNY